MLDARRGSEDPRRVWLELLNKKPERVCQCSQKLSELQQSQRPVPLSLGRRAEQVPRSRSRLDFRAALRYRRAICLTMSTRDTTLADMLRLERQRCRSAFVETSTMTTSEPRAQATATCIYGRTQPTQCTRYRRQPGFARTSSAALVASLRVPARLLVARPTPRAEALSSASTWAVV